MAGGHGTALAVRKLVDEARRTALSRNLESNRLVRQIRLWIDDLFACAVGATQCLIAHCCKSSELSQASFEFELHPYLAHFKRSR